MELNGQIQTGNTTEKTGLLGENYVLDAIEHLIPRTVKYNEDTIMDDETRKVINEQYQLGNSIQTIARTHRYEVEEICDVLGLNDLLVVETVGDLVDSSELDPGTVISGSKKHRVPYSTN